MPPKGDPNKGASDDGEKRKEKGAEGGAKKPKDHVFNKNPNSAGNPGKYKKENKTQEGKKKYGSQSNLSQQYNQKSNMGSQSNLSQQFNQQANIGSQSSSSNRPAGGLATDGITSDEVKNLLECPVCFEIPRPPIFNCQSGHITCGECRSKTNNCPLCRQGYSDVRNFIAEKLVESCTFKCFFHSQGCEAMIKGNQEEAHMQVCNFRPVGCEIFPCKGRHVDYRDFLSHLRKEHKAIVNPSNQPKWEREVYVKKPERLMQQGYRVPVIMNCFGQTFLQFAQAVGGKMWFWVSLLGTPEQAGRYRATITISTQNKDMKSIWVGPVHSVRHSGDDIYLNGLCMVTTEECLKAFFHTSAHAEGFPCYTTEVCIEKMR